MSHGRAPDGRRLTAGQRPTPRSPSGTGHSATPASARPSPRHRALIHLPMRGNQPPSRELPEDATRRLDLVLLHHSLRPCRLGSGQKDLREWRRTWTIPKCDDAF
ncbi:hypothetical protein EYS09_12520 [Streptomyces kasugaensis]|uniref:Uncharacterized protein n=1 Tax=Streptomyces kasugaensis TaxID=1946 RepID=A0A4Q9HW13_STRKA|nr:hypothetical protein EYS09_12520 [Streptomyces kasugaensis]